MPASKDACVQCNKTIYGKQKCIKCIGPCASRYHLSCLNISEAEYSYMATRESTFKCASYVKSLKLQRSDDTPVKTRSDAPVISEAVSPAKVISPERALVWRSIFAGDKYEAQIVQLDNPPQRTMRSRSLKITFRSGA
jgi:hypothetical protein